MRAIATLLWALAGVIWGTVFGLLWLGEHILAALTHR